MHSCVAVRTLASPGSVGWVFKTGSAILALIVFTHKTLQHTETDFIIGQNQSSGIFFVWRTCHSAECQGTNVCTAEFQTMSNLPTSIPLLSRSYAAQNARKKPNCGQLLPTISSSNSPLDGAVRITSLNPKFLEAILNCHPALSTEWLAGWHIPVYYDVCALPLLRGAWRDRCFPEPFSWFLHEKGLESLKITSALCFLLKCRRKDSKKRKNTASFVASLGAGVQPRSTVQLFMPVSGVEKTPFWQFFLWFGVSLGESKPFVNSNDSF